MDKKVVFVTGASRGIGAATVKKFVNEGWAAVGFYNKNKIEDSENVKYVQMDIENPESIKTSFEKAYQLFGRVDALVNNAGVFGGCGLNDYTLEKMDHVYAVNERGTYLCTKKIIEHLSFGSIVNVSSTAAQVGSTDPIYAASKAAVAAFTKSMAKALAPKIRVNCVAPGVVNTEMAISYYDEESMEKRKKQILLGDIAAPDDVANGIYFLASDNASHITGACLDINGGYVLR